MLICHFELSLLRSILWWAKRTYKKSFLSPALGLHSVFTISAYLYAYWLPRSVKTMSRDRKVLIGVLVTIVLLCGMVGMAGAAFRLGSMMDYRRAVQYYDPSAAPQAPRAVPQPAPRGRADFYGPLVHRGRGSGVFGFVGGIVGFFIRLMGTLLFIGLIIFLVRGVFFGRWGRGPGGWAWRGPGGGGAGVPPFFEEWHRRAHGQDANSTNTNASPAQAPQNVDPAAGPVTDGDKPKDEQSI
jgi:hypothetical protein